MIKRRIYALDPEALTLPWLESPFASSLLERAELTPSLRAFCAAFRDQGCLVLDSGIPAASLRALARRLPEDDDPGDEPPRPRHGPECLVDLTHSPDAELREGALAVATHPGTLDLLRVLYRREPVPVRISCCRSAPEQPAHSDALFHSATPARFGCAVALALEDVSPEAGPIHYYPGSHRLPVFDLHDLGLAGSLPDPREGSAELLREYHAFVRALVRAQGLERQSFAARRGQMLIWSSNLLHGSEAPRDASLGRATLVTQFSFEAASCYSPLRSDVALGRLALEDVVNLRTGAREPARYLGMPLERLDEGRICLRVPVGPPPSPPVRLATRAPLRLLGWPDYGGDALRDWLERWLPPVSGRRDVCVCLRHDPLRDGISLEELVTRFERELSAIELRADCEFLIVDDPLLDEDWPRLGAELSACLGESADTGRAALLASVSVPLLGSAAELERVLGDLLS